MMKLTRVQDIDTVKTILIFSLSSKAYPSGRLYSIPTRIKVITAVIVWKTTKVTKEP